jgi:hypothetical protein
VVTPRSAVIELIIAAGASTPDPMKMLPMNRKASAARGSTVRGAASCASTRPASAGVVILSPREARMDRLPSYGAVLLVSTRLKIAALDDAF